MKQFITMLFLFLAINAEAQIAVKGIYFNPTSDLGVTFKKRFTGEILYLQELDEDENFRGRAGLCYIPLKSRLDTFPSYAVRSGNGTTVLPGYEIYKKYNMGFLFVGVDWAFLNKEPYYVYIGCDAIGGGINVEYEASYQTYKDESFSGGYSMAGLRFRTGFQYDLNDHFAVFGELSRSYYGIEETGFQSHYDFGIGLQFIF